MAEVKDITPGNGFFSAAGDLKSKEQLTTDTKSTDKSGASQSSNQTGSSQTSSSDAASAEFSGQVGDAIGKVQGRFIEKSNEIINVIHIDEQNINKAEKIVKEQINTAKDLKAAIKDGETDKADKLRDKLSKLSEKRADLVAEIKKDNSEVLTSRTKNLSLGNEQKGIVSTKEVKFSKSDEADLSSAKGVTDFIQSLKSDKAQLDVQRKDVREKKQEVKEIINDTKKQLGAIKKNALDTFEKASSAADKIASKISQGGEAFLAHKIDENIASKLLAA
jgi:hypothetical protein